MKKIIQKITLTIQLIGLIGIYSCDQKHEGFKKHKENFYSQLISFDDKQQSVSKGCFIQFNWLIINKKDTLFKQRVLQEIKTLNTNGGLLEALSLLKENETRNFIFPFSKIENEFKSKLKNIDLKDSSNFIHQLSIDKIYLQKEYSMDKKQFLKWIKKTNNLSYQSFENYLIHNYIKKESTQFKKSNSGLYFKIINSNSGKKIKSGDPIQLKYSGGPLIRNSKFINEEIIQDFNVGQELQVIKAIEEVLLYLCVGDSAVIVSPSELAFGNKGSSTGIIPPYSPVVYSIKVVK